MGKHAGIGLIDMREARALMLGGTLKVQAADPAFNQKRPGDEAPVFVFSGQSSLNAVADSQLGYIGLTFDTSGFRPSLNGPPSWWKIHRSGNLRQRCAIGRKGEGPHFVFHPAAGSGFDP